MSSINELPFCLINGKMHSSPSLVLHGILSKYRSDSSITDSEFAEFVCCSLGVYMDNNNLFIAQKQDVKTGEIILLFEKDQRNGE